MSVVKTNRMGAGDGNALPIRNQKRRPQVPSARKFATRGVVANPDNTKKLKAALDEFGNKSESPFKRRSLSMAEINSNEHRMRRESMDCVKVAPTAHLASLEAAADSEERRLADAGRRVCHLLVLNAWRRRRSEVAALSESCRLQQGEIHQLNMQVDLLKRLRIGEVTRVEQANLENKSLTQQLEEVRVTNSSLLLKISERNRQMEYAEINANKLSESMLNERNVNFTLRNDIKHTQERLLEEQKIVNRLKEEIRKLMNELSNIELRRSEDEAVHKKFEEIAQRAEMNYLASTEKNKVLEKANKDLHRQHEELLKEKSSVQEQLYAARSKYDKLDLKLTELNKKLQSHRAAKKKQQDENDELREELKRIQKEFKAHNDRHWMLKTGAFLFEKFTFCAYMLFPAMPSLPSREVMKELVVLDRSIALGSL